MMKSVKLNDENMICQEDSDKTTIDVRGKDAEDITSLECLEVIK